MFWVDHKRFFGLDRRKARPVLKYGERRQESSLVEAPSLASAVLQLRSRALTANTPKGVADFADRTKIVAELARAYAKPTIAEALMEMGARVRAQPNKDWSLPLSEDLSRMATVLE